MKLLVNIIGWIGTTLFILAYFLVSNDYVEPSGAVYQFMNLAGAAGVFVNVFSLKAWPAAVLQIVWFSIALVALVGIFF